MSLTLFMFGLAVLRPLSKTRHSPKWCSPVTSPLFPKDGPIRGRRPNNTNWDTLFGPRLTLQHTDDVALHLCINVFPSRRSTGTTRLCCLMSSGVGWHIRDKLRPMPTHGSIIIALRPRKPEGSLGRTARDGHLDSHTAPELWYWHEVV